MLVLDSVVKIYAKCRRVPAKSSCTALYSLNSAYYSRRAYLAGHTEYGFRTSWFQGINEKNKKNIWFFIALFLFGREQLLKWLFAYIFSTFILFLLLLPWLGVVVGRLCCQNGVRKKNITHGGCNLDNTRAMHTYRYIQRSLGLREYADIVCRESARSYALYQVLNKAKEWARKMSETGWR